MPYYRFGISGTGLSEEPKVAQLPDIGCAKAEAARLFGDIIANQAKLEHGKPLGITVTDAKGTALIVFSFGIVEFTDEAGFS